MAKRLSYAQRQALAQQDVQFLAMPLHSDPRSIEAQLRKMARLLGNRQSASPCSDAVGYLTQLFERTVDELTPPQAKQQMACKQGCSFCCNQPVRVTAPEVFFLAAAIRGRADLVSAAQEGARRAAQLNPYTDKRWMACPLLKDNACTVYAARPISCHTYVSVNVTDCFNTLVLLNKQSVRPLPLHVPVAEISRTVLYAAIIQCGQSHASYELNAALSVALAKEDSEARWLKGENIFAAVETLPPRPPAYEAELVRLAAAVGLTL